MEKAGSLDSELVSSLFNSGFMGIEVPEEYGGSGLNFTSSLLLIEEMAKVDPSVAVMVDIHNTLTLLMVKNEGTEEQKQRW